MDLQPSRDRARIAISLGLVIAAVLVLISHTRTSSRLRAAVIPSPTRPSVPADLGQPATLPLPSTLTVPRYEARLFAFLNDREYVRLDWARDKGVRDTGPFVDGTSFGTHPAVRVYYSPGVVRWLFGGRSGPIPDGEMIIKEQYAAPAIRHEGKSEEQLRASLESWTVMVKDSKGSHDGWFWSNPAAGQCVADDHRYPFAHPTSGFGHYCLRCHAATRSPGAEAASPSNEFTFASLRNIEGFPGTPLTFDVDDSWKEATVETTPTEDRPRAHLPCRRSGSPGRPERIADSRFLHLFDTIAGLSPAEVSPLPPVTHDWVAHRREPALEFATSNQCMGCHAALTAPFGPTMFVPEGPDAGYGARGRDFSPYGEWRWTPMGLAGRDPIVYAQIESEIRSLREDFRSDPELAGELCSTLSETCLRCHGAMGHRQFDLDHPGEDSRISLYDVQGVAGPEEHLGHGPSRYGALARDGVSCVICHRMQPRERPADDPRSDLQFFLETSITGNYQLGPKGEIYGPFPDREIAPYAMEHATGLRPRQGTFLGSSRLCGTCHAVSLPTVDRPLDHGTHGHPADELTVSEVVPLFRKFHHHVEQATYLEWLNSEYENEIDPANPKGRSCQDCHMSRGLADAAMGIDLPRLRTRIAAIQDTTYPEAENLASPDQLEVRVRDEGYRRHNFAGLNAFLIEMFRQGDDVLGVAKTDFMTGSTTGLDRAIEGFARTARDDVATLDVEARLLAPDRLEALVRVGNKVGHRFPSGVGFRRAFLEFLVVEPPSDPGGRERIVWASGRTDPLGVILDADGRPLATEFFGIDPATGRQRHQPHHEIITSSEQVQIYETLLLNAKGEFTTSFIRGCETVKDNRLLPRGWRPEGPSPALAGRFLAATHPRAEAAADPRYRDGSGSDEVRYRVDLPAGVDPARLQVRATLYYQAIPPYYLRNLFESTPDGPATRRLHHLCSGLNLEGTPIEGWKLPITSATIGVIR